MQDQDVDIDPAEISKIRTADVPIVGDVRGEGFFYGIELVKDKATKETFTEAESERILRGFLSTALFDAGLYCRADDRGDPVIQLAPPLIIGQPEFDDIEQAYLQLHADPNKVARVASWAAQVSLAAEAGDEVSVAICRQAGAQLACSTATGLRRVGLGDEDSPVALLGGVMRSALIRESLEIGLDRLAPRAWIVEPILGFALSFWDFSRDNVVKFLPSQATNAMVDPVTMSGPGMVEPLSWWAGALVLTAYAVVLAGLGVLRAARQDVA